ncbi:MAG: HPP family protein [Paracoccus sp. (in: a-proteobacteria)]|nr:HPP family protein [Paracoccus sp. (in: a-proteobacteria)]
MIAFLHRPARVINEKDRIDQHRSRRCEIAMLMPVALSLTSARRYDAGNHRDVNMVFLSALGPVIPRPHLTERIRAAAGALIGLMIAGWVELAMGLSPIFLAPLGATAVLVFAVPNSPLAQPWSSVLGSFSAAVVAIPVTLWLPMPWAAAVAVGLAIAVMSSLRALHPPGGAVALMTAITVAPEAPFALLPPLVLGTTALVVFGMIWARLTGRVYPMRPAEAAGETVARFGLHRAELEDLLVRFRQGPNLGATDLGRLLAAAEAEAALHRFDGTTCGDVMTQSLISVAPEAGVSAIAAMFAGNRIKSLPVVGPQGELLGVIQQNDLIAALTRKTGTVATARDMMRSGTPRVPVSMPVGALLDQLAVQGAQIVAVMEGARIVGVITRSDVIGLLLRDYQQRKDETAAADQGHRPV